MKYGLKQYTLDHFFNKVVSDYSSNPALALINEVPFTYEEFGIRVDKLRETLINLGYIKGDKIIILGSSSPNWAIAFLAITTMGAVAVPILEGFPEADIDHITKHSEAVAIFISESLYQSLTLPAIEEMKCVFKLDDLSLRIEDMQSNSGIWKQLHDLPEKLFKSVEKAIRPAPGKNIEEDDIAEILYTSGTTGYSKGVMLTHKNLVSNLFEGPDLLKVINEESVVLSILPMAHAFGSTSAFLSIIYRGSSIYYLDKLPSPKILLDAMQKVKPTIMGAVPLVFEKIFHKQVVPAISKSFALRLLTKSKFTRKLIYKKIGKKVNNLLGGNLKCVIIGGASFSPDVEEFMQEGKIPYCCGYGLSECSPLVTFSSMDKQKTGSPGHAITDVEIRIMDPDPDSGVGRICIKGPNVMKGYYKNAGETKKAFTEDGWFISGDLGYLDEDGFLFITGRSKNLIVGPSGENIYPEVIEAKLLESILVEETIVYLADDGQLVARIHPNYAYIENLKNEKDEDAIALNIIDLLKEIQMETNEKLPASSRIKRVIEQSSPFVTTPTNKIKRVEYVPGYLENNKK
ncbi:MAG: AMP-binding protein [Bacteroidetes bacterium]|nr:AMP-binding protein [Bacteroidota bacterium]